MSDDTSPLTDELQQLLGQFERLLKSTLPTILGGGRCRGCCGLRGGVLLARRKS